jgi:hypothetical protein
MSKRPRPFVLPTRRPTDARPPGAPRAIGRATTRAIGPADIVIVNGDSVRVCRVDAASRALSDGPAPVSLCRDSAGDVTAPADGLNVTRVGGVLMLRVE